jgi:hypothetical protein
MFLKGEPRRAKESSFFRKKTLFAVDGYFWLDTLLTPPEAGPDSVGVVLAYFGTAN